jgi:signal recognition particle subunit SRP19
LPSKKEGIIVLYPEYFDKALSRADGRRVPRKVAVNKPDTKSISNAARKLGFKNKVESDAHFSGTWHMKRGRVLILSKKTKKGEKCNKAEIIARIATRLKAREKRLQEE